MSAAPGERGATGDIISGIEIKDTPSAGSCAQGIGAVGTRSAAGVGGLLYRLKELFRREGGGETDSGIVVCVMEADEVGSASSVTISTST